MWLIWANAPTAEYTPSRESIQHASQHSYAINLKPLVAPFPYFLERNEVGTLYFAPLGLYEDGQPLGPNTRDDKAILQGGGSYLRTGDTLYFSTSDSTDPRNNRRTYRITAETTPHPNFVAAAVVAEFSFLLALALGFLPPVLRRHQVSTAAYHEWIMAVPARLCQVLNRQGVILLLMLPFGIYVYVLSIGILPSVPWVSPDSFSYLGLNNHRSLLYPVLLRLSAVVSNDPRILIATTMATGISGIVFLAVTVQLLVKNLFASVAVGVFLLFSWLLVEHSVFVLSDYPFFALVTWTFGFAIRAFVDPRKRWIVLAAVGIGLATAIRPVGLILVVMLPFILFARRCEWKRTAAHFMIPLAVLLGLQSTANFVVFGSFSLSKFSGYPAAANIGILITEDLSFRYPELVRRVSVATRQYRDRYYKLQTSRERHDYLASNTNLLISTVARVTQEFRREKGLIEPSEERRLPRHRRLFKFVNSLSSLNTAIGRAPIKLYGTSFALDSLLVELGRATFLGNLQGLAGLAWHNIRGSWPSVMVHGVAPPLTFGHYLAFDAEQPNLRRRVSETAASLPKVYLISFSGFTAIGAFIERIQQTISLAGLYLVALSVYVAVIGYQIAFRIRPSPVLVCLVMLGAVTTAFQLVYAVAQIPLPRYLLGVGAAPPVVLFSVFVFAWNLAVAVSRNLLLAINPDRPDRSK